jgi:hypothetical protein
MIYTEGSFEYLPYLKHKKACYLLVSLQIKRNIAGVCEIIKAFSPSKDWIRGTLFLPVISNFHR